MLRYELEKRLVSGELMVEEVPSAWNELSQNLLGLPIRDDRQGCLQDVHWASGDIGYFPTYVLGNLYGAQIWSALSSRMDVEKLLSEGDLRTISRWLAENIYVNGMQDKILLLKKCKHFVLDMDGTFYLGDSILPNSLAFLEKVKETGRDFIFYTNNSSKSPEVYIQKLAKMDCHIQRRQIMTSGDVMIEWLQANHKGEPVYLVGTPPLEQSFREAGINLVEEGARIVVIGFDTTLTYAKLVKACDFIRGGALFLATHLDINCPVEGGFIPDVGSFCALISLSTGGKQPRVLGKPHGIGVDAYRLACYRVWNDCLSCGNAQHSQRLL